MKNKYLFLGGLMAVIAAAGVLLLRGGMNGKVNNADKKIQIASSFYPVYLGALSIGEGSENLEIINLTQNAGGCLHDYQLTTDDMVRLGNADLFLINGGGMEAFIEETAKQYPDLKMVDTGERLWDDKENAHIWLYPEYYKLQLETIKDALSELSPEQRSVFENNFNRFSLKLDELTAKGVELSEELKGKPVILLHEGFEYLADLSGLDPRAVMDLDEETQLSAAELAGLVELAKNEPNLVILYDEEYGKDAAELIQRESGAEIIVLNPVTSGSSSPEEYYQAMTENLQKLEEALLP